jgi:hypothetical protein
MTIHSVRSAVLLGVALVSAGCGRQEGVPAPAARSVNLPSGISATAGIGVTKSCPTSIQQSGAIFRCQFKITNQDPANPVTGLTVTNTAPCPNPPLCSGGTKSPPLPCTGGTDATTLAPAGTAGDSCTGTVEETAPDCSVGSVGDFIQASGTGSGGKVGGGAAHNVPIAPCTPPPTNVRGR